MTVENLDIVIVGATGNLAKLKLLPALYDLESEGLLPRRGSIVGLARSSLSDEAFRGLAEESARQGARMPWDDGTWARLAPRLRFLRSDADGFARLRRGTSRTGASRLPGDPAGRLWRHHPLPGRRGPDRGHAAADREAVRARSGLRLRPGYRATPGAERVADLPHRSLPGQGNGAEHPGLSIRQRGLRSVSGTETRSTTSRSRSPSRPESMAAAPSTRRSAPCATLCRTTCCRCSRF